MDAIDALVKGAGHKYKSRKPDGKGGYLYDYGDELPKAKARTWARNKDGSYQMPVGYEMAHLRKEGKKWTLTLKGHGTVEMPKKASFDHAEKQISAWSREKGSGERTTVPISAKDQAKIRPDPAALAQHELKTMRAERDSLKELLAQVTQKSGYDPRVIRLAEVRARIRELKKAAGHKYKSRKPDGKGGYLYDYGEGYGVQSKPQAKKKGGAASKDLRSYTKTQHQQAIDTLAKKPLKELRQMHETTDAWREKALDSVKSHTKREGGGFENADRELEATADNLSYRLKHIDSAIGKKAFGADSAKDAARLAKKSMDAIDDLIKGGPYYGKRGGKYRDPQHKVSWGEDRPTVRAPAPDDAHDRPTKLAPKMPEKPKEKAKLTERAINVKTHATLMWTDLSVAQKLTAVDFDFAKQLVQKIKGFNMPSGMTQEDLALEIQHTARLNQKNVQKKHSRQGMKAVKSMDAIDGLEVLAKGAGWGSIPGGKKGGQRQPDGKGSFRYRYPDGSGGWKSSPGGKSKRKAKAKGKMKSVKKTIQVFANDGKGAGMSIDVEAHVFGNWASHKATNVFSKEKYVVTHLGTGRVAGYARTQAGARALATKYQEKAPNALKGLGFGGLATKDAHGKDLEKLNAAKAEWESDEKGRSEEKAGKKAAAQAEKQKDAKGAYSKKNFDAGSKAAKEAVDMEEHGHHEAAAKLYARAADLMTFAAEAADEAGNASASRAAENRYEKYGQLAKDATKKAADLRAAKNKEQEAKDKAEREKPGVPGPTKGHYTHNGRDYADTGLVQRSQKAMPGFTLEHVGMGDFDLKGPDDGRISFSRADGLNFGGQDGRAHTMSDNKGGALVKQLLDSAGGAEGGRDKNPQQEFAEAMNKRRTGDGRYAEEHKEAVAALSKYDVNDLLTLYEEEGQKLHELKGQNKYPQVQAKHREVMDYAKEALAGKDLAPGVAAHTDAWDQMRRGRDQDQIRKYLMEKRGLDYKTAQTATLDAWYGRSSNKDAAPKSDPNAGINTGAAERTRKKRAEKKATEAKASDPLEEWRKKKAAMDTKKSMDAIDGLGQLAKGEGGWAAAPGSKKGAQRKKSGKGYTYRYPDGKGGWTSKKGASGKGSGAEQKAKQRATSRGGSQRDKAFQEMQSSGNPLTNADIEKLIEKNPVYVQFRGRGIDAKGKTSDTFSALTEAMDQPPFFGHSEVKDGMEGGGFRATSGDDAFQVNILPLDDGQLKVTMEHRDEGYAHGYREYDKIVPNAAALDKLLPKMAGNAKAVLENSIELNKLKSKDKPKTKVVTPQVPTKRAKAEDAYFDSLPESRKGTDKDGTRTVQFRIEHRDGPDTFRVKPLSDLDTEFLIRFDAKKSGYKKSGDALDGLEALAKGTMTGKYVGGRLAVADGMYGMKGKKKKGDVIQQLIGKMKRAGVPTDVVQQLIGKMKGDVTQQLLGKCSTKKSEYFEPSLKKGLYAFQSEGKHPLPDNLLPQYLAAFVEQAYEHEKQECLHQKNEPAGQDEKIAFYSMRIMNCLVMCMRSNKDLVRAGKGVTAVSIGRILSNSGLIQPDVSGYDSSGNGYEAMAYSAPRHWSDLQKGPEKRPAATVEAPQADFIDDTTNPMDELQKAQRQAAKRVWTVPEGTYIAKGSAACPIHGYRDLTKMMNLANIYGKCSCS